MGVKYINNSIKTFKTLAESRHLSLNLPRSFDARQQWK